MRRGVPWGRVLMSCSILGVSLTTTTAPLLSPSAQAAARARQHPRAAGIPTRCAKRNPAGGSAVVGSVFQPPTSSSVFTYGVLSSVFGVDSKGHTFPEMATTIPTLENHGIRDGGKTVVIHLKPGMRWSNGTEITSAAFAFGWKIASDPAGGPMCAPACVVAHVDTPDRYTAVYHLTSVDHAFLLADIPVPWPVRWPGEWNSDPHAAVLQIIKPSFGTAPDYPSDGPYQVVRVVAGNSMELRPMKYYDVMNCGAFIKHLTYQNYGTTAQELAALEAGKPDLAEISTLTAPVLAFRRVRGPYRMHVDPSGTIEQLVFNVDSGYGGQPNPLHDVRVRQALALALDKRALITNALGLNARQVSNVIQWTFCVNSPKYHSACADRSITGQWDPIARRFDANPGTGVALLHAKQLLAETRWRGGFTLDFAGRSDTLYRLAEQASLASSWARLGVKLKIADYPPSVLFGSYEQGGVLALGHFQATLEAFNVNAGVDYFMQNSLTTAAIPRRTGTHTPFQTNYGGISDPVIDRAVAGATRTLDDRVRARNFELVQEEVARKDYLDVLYGQAYSYLEDRRIANLSDSVDNDNFAAYVFWNMWAWKINKRVPTRGMM